jgi:hypothetical protein
MMTDSETDPHGQPFNIRFNRARRAERDLSELLGLAKGLLADGEVTKEEADLLDHWVRSHPAASEQWPVNRLAARLQHAYADGHVDDEERRDLAEILSALVGGTAGLILGEDAATALPIDTPPPLINWPGSIFVFTGKFAYGTRSECERLAVARGSTCERNVTKNTHYLVIGTFGSRDWIHTSFGRKIEKAVGYRAAGSPLRILAEEYWSSVLETTA